MHGSTADRSAATGSVPRREAYPVREAAELLGIHERTVWKLVKAGDLESFMVGRRRLVSAVAIHQFIEKQTALTT